MTEAPSIQYEMPKAYEPGKVEAKWYQFWLERGIKGVRLLISECPVVSCHPE